MGCLCVCLEIAQKEEAAAERKISSTKVSLCMCVYLSVCVSARPFVRSFVRSACDLVLSFNWKCVSVCFCAGMLSPLFPGMFSIPGEQDGLFVSAGKCVWETHNAKDNINSPNRHVCRNVCACEFMCVCVCCNRGQMAPNECNPSFMLAPPQFVTPNQDIWSMVAK